MRLALSEGVPQPSRAQLRAYYNTNSARYQVPETVTFGHVYFEPGSGPTDPAEPLEALRGGADFSALGDRFWMGPILERVTREQVAGALGPDFAEAVFSMPTGEWQGPVESSRGTHYVAVAVRHPPETPPFEAVEPQVEADWVFERRTDITERRLNRMRAGYEVEYDPAVTERLREEAGQ